MSLTEEEAKEYELAREIFHAPEGYEHFLFAMPLYFVAIADGKVDVKEIVKIPFIKVSHGIIANTDEKETELRLEFTSNIRNYIEKERKPEHLKLLARAINYKLREYPPEEAKKIRTNIYEACVEVAEASGPMFRDKMCKEEREMIDQIFHTIGKGEHGKKKC